MAKRVQRKRTKGWRMPENTVYVGRGTPYGNPYKVGDKHVLYADGMGCFFQEGYEFHGAEVFTIHTIADAVYWFRIKTKRRLEHGHLHDRIREIKGKNLACWCPLDQPCHADVLLELANGDVK